MKASIKGNATCLSRFYAVFFCVSQSLYATGSDDSYDSQGDPDSDPFGIYDPIDLKIGTNLPEGKWRIVGSQTLFGNGEDLTIFGVDGENSVVYADVPGYITPPIHHVTYSDFIGNRADGVHDVIGVYLPDFDATIAKVRNYSFYRGGDEKSFAPDADLDGDGYSNLAEWAFGMDLADVSRSARYRQDVYAAANPSSAFPDLKGPPAVSLIEKNGKTFVIVCFSQLRAGMVPNLRYVVETSGNGVAWSEADTKICPLNILGPWQRNEASFEVDSLEIRTGLQVRVKVILGSSEVEEVNVNDEVVGQADDSFWIYDPIDLRIGTNIPEGLWRIVGSQSLFGNGENTTIFGIYGENAIVFADVPGFVTPPIKHITFSDYRFDRSTGAFDVKGLYVPGVSGVPSFSEFMRVLEDRGGEVIQGRRGSHGDFDGDGFSNLQEWAFGMNIENYDHIEYSEFGTAKYGTVTDVKGPPEVRKSARSGGSDFYYLYYTRLANDDAGYAPEYSNDGGNTWTAMERTPRVRKTKDQWERVYTYDYLPKLAQGSYQFRVRLTYSEAE